MSYVRALAVLASLSSFGCDPDCMEDGYARGADGSLDYTLAAEQLQPATGNVTSHGAMPATLTMFRFEAFDDNRCSLDDDRFAIEIAPLCVLRARALGRDYDSGKYSSKNFTSAAGDIDREQVCTIALSDGRRVEGTVDSGSLTIFPSTARLALALRVHRISGAGARGYLRITMDVTWE